MWKNLFVLLRYFGFWLLFFAIERSVFMLYYADRISGASFSEILQAFFFGLWMDASMAGYISAIPLLVFVVMWFIPRSRINPLFLRIYTSTLVVIFSLLTVVNFNIYREWGTKVNFRAIEFAFGSPAEAFSSTGSSPVFLSVSVFLVLAALGIYLSRRIIHHKMYRMGRLWIKIPFAILLLGFNFLAIRGGWQLSPMNESMAYFSLKPILNYSAVNTEWSLMNDILKSKYNTNPYPYYSPEESRAIVDQFYSRPDTANTRILSTTRPNIVLIIMESFTGNVVKSLGGEENVNPAMERLIKEGVFFNNIYASGGRTDKGVVSILSAFPAQGKRSIMKENSKQVKIPALSQTFAAAGYPTSFFYGGESRFFNMRSYLLSHNYQRIIDKNDFEQKDMSSKWGAYDGTVFQKTIAELNKEKAPFFSTVLTLTNHEPFDLPVAPKFPGDDVKEKFKSTAYYADSCLGAFIEQARKESWYNNTLFVMVADHGHYLPVEGQEIYDPKRYRIPLLFFGEVIKPEFRGRVIEKIGSQTDVAATILKQTGLSANGYPWSRNLLNPEDGGFSFFNWEQGFGFVIPKQTISYDIMSNHIIYRRNEGMEKLDQELSDYAKAFMQEVYQQYIDY